MGCKKRYRLAAAVWMVGMLCGCQLIPVEEKLPEPPVIRSYQVEEYQQVAVGRRDLVEEEVASCTYQALQKENLSFRLGGESIGAVYAQLGQSVNAGELLAELVYDTLAEQIQTQEYQLAKLKMQKSHLQTLKTLELERQEAQLENLKAQLTQVETWIQQRTDWEKQWQAYEEQQKQWEQAWKLWKESQTDSDGTQTTTPEVSLPFDEMPSGMVSNITAEPPEKPQEPAPCQIEETLEMLNRKKEELERSYQEQVSRKASVERNYDQQITAAEDSLYIQQLRMRELEAQREERRIYAGIDGIVSFVKTDRVEIYGSNGMIASDQIGTREKSVKNETFISLLNPDSMLFTVTGEKAAYFPVGTEIVIRCENREIQAVSVEKPEFAEAPEDTECAFFEMVTPDPSLKDGATGKIHWVSRELKDVLCVPKEVVHVMEGQTFVYILNEDGLKVMQEVSIGEELDGYVEIRNGLKENDLVIVE